MAQRMLEEHTYFCFTYLNWQRDDAWEHYRPFWAGCICPDLPGPIQSLVMSNVRSSVLRDLHGQVCIPLLLKLMYLLSLIHI